MQTTRATVACLQAVTGGFIAESPPFANRAPSWIFEARAPGYERVSAKIEGERGGGKRKTGGFSPLSPPPSPRSLCQLSTRPRPGRANSRWRPHHEFRFFDPPSQARATAITTSINNDSACLFACKLCMFMHFVARLQNTRPTFWNS